ncbi:Lipoamide acyltransferase component of branched-chain alpha-keto acid dehydrogenase complex (plasmid) [Tsukamurella tyrosinosolvens]|uniref:Dihydrolipoamide acetyltransferase component of pyruvate dehydrogenase complex n=2 Tax=Tsukamurella tyrosinosolvens TaxID=57704 RepID=A0A1H4X651_TSUTY|nr:dihydrolipoamide acetyltransferase family protein [Tsukamurella tyrosinosolvens]KXP00464.1 branched-chain alpha-keto acid dehydrogenase subunit E2 [Tsukamurella tyrosinosolvens]SED00700.1 pyruvate dehydrogenase E2 component (dihydrolipoamide acetyltransferase) [Tsukamurella tyrosinosolvens]VEH98254.1 Lipoamide acyltransferase component of branched-chain alpha-keto acid dehydrogenase complex [Tsukamurella tyrosinosolvens]
MSDQVFLLPDLGEGLTEADILSWRVGVGDTVTVDQVVVEVETAKAAVEVPVPFAGTVTALHGAPGATLRVGEPLISVGAPSPTTTAAPPLDEPSGNVLIGYGTSADKPARRRRAAAPPRTVASPPAPPREHEAPPRAQAAPAVARVISPVVRDLAREHGLDLSTVRPSGVGGVIRRADVDAALAARTAAPAHEGTAAGRSDVRIPLNGLRKAVADKLTTSRREIPEATTWVDVDATALLDARAAMNATLPGAERVGLLALLARLTVAALRRFPQLNASVDVDRRQIVQHGRVHLGIAAQTPRGLVVPVIADADTLTTVELARRLAETTALARDGALPPARLTGGTFTLNNYGVFGVDGSAPIINHPEAAILGIGRILDRPWVVDGAIVVRKVAQISLAFDHRVCDGGEAGGFLRLFADYVEDPVRALAYL